MAPVTARPPLEALRELVEARATGELVCTTDEGELHVHLQEGRVAWATSSCATFSFSSYIVQRCNIDRAALRDLVEECRRNRRPFGETLVEWGIASEDTVREALERQVREALVGMRSTGHAVFLPRGRGYRTYGAALTFELDRVLPERRARRTSSQRLPLTPALPPGAGHERLAALMAAEPGIRWAELHAPGGVARLGAGPDDHELGALNGTLFGPGGARFAAVRTVSEVAVGMAVDRGEGVVWCGLAPELVLAATILQLERTLRVSEIQTPRPLGPGDGLEVGPDRGIAPHVLGELMRRTDEIWGVAVSRGADVTEVVARRSPMRDEQLLAAVRPALALLRRRALGASIEPFGTSTMVASSAGHLYGGRFLDDTDRCVWLFVDGAAPLGLGWALTTSILRETTRTLRELGAG